MVKVKNTDSQKSTKKNAKTIKSGNTSSKKGVVKNVANAGGVIKRRPHRFRPGTVAAREVLKEMRSKEFAIPKTSFKRLVRTVLNEQGYHDKRMGGNMSETLQTYIEQALIGLNKAGVSNMYHCNRKTIHPSDLRLVIQTQLDLSNSPSHLVNAYQEYMIDREIMGKNNELMDYLTRHGPPKSKHRKAAKKANKSKNTTKKTKGKGKVASSDKRAITPTTTAKKGKETARVSSSQTRNESSQQHIASSILNEKQDSDSDSDSDSSSGSEAFDLGNATGDRRGTFTF
jgi:histone H3/H4